MEVSDVVAIQQLYALYGHIADDGAWERFSELFTEDASFDATSVGAPPMHGLTEIVATSKSSPLVPLAHHITNVVVTEVNGDTAQMRGKVLTLFPEGRVFSGTYDDTLQRTQSGWRISARVYRTVG